MNPRPIIARITQSTLLVAVLSLNPCFGESDLATLQEQHLKSISTPEGRSFQMQAVRTFWGDTSFMRKCVADKFPDDETFTIYFEIKIDGSLGEIHIIPDNELAKCIVKNVGGRTFPVPPSAFVAKVELAFER